MRSSSSSPREGRAGTAVEDMRPRIGGAIGPAPATASAVHEPLEQRLLRVAAVLGLLPDALPVAVEDLGGDLLARMRGQAVQGDRVGRGLVEQRVVELVGRERGTAL